MYKFLLIFILSACCFTASAQWPKWLPHPPPPPSRDSVRKMQEHRQHWLDTMQPPAGTILYIGFEPNYTFNNAFKFDISLKPAGRKFAVELTPEFYTGPHILGHNDDNVSGFGLGLYHQIYLFEGNHSPVMFSYGATYRHINVAYADEGFIPFQQNGLEYYSYSNFKDVLKINSLMANVYTIVRVTGNYSPVFLDFYAGFGIKFASAKATYPGFRSYNTTFIDYAYHGPMILLGMKFGMSAFFNQRDANHINKRD